MDNKVEIVIFGGGCFWCTEAVFKGLKGVISVVPGYAGGSTENPKYREVCTGRTGHAEVIKVEFDPKQISYVDLLMVFFATHDPTTLNRQGNDLGVQYRSIIIYTSKEQRFKAEAFIKRLNTNEKKQVVTELRSLTKFYPAEEYHRNYYIRNSSQPYCQLVISPKLKKLKEKYFKLLKKVVK